MRLFPLALAWTLLLGAGAVNAEVRAWLDRAEIALGETVTLNVEIKGAGVQAPDFSPLDKDFRRLGTSSNSQISIVNGQRTATTLFAVALEPRQEGVATVPSLEVAGTRTEPLVLTVRASTISSGAGGDLFLEVDVQPRDPYVQQQVLYTLRLYYAISLLDGQLDPPELADARFVRLGDDIRYQQERDGRRYMVIERRFALVPERSGELPLPPARFAGRGQDRSGLGSMFGGGVRLAAAGQAFTLQVRPRPASASDPWLPATSLTLQDDAPGAPAEVEIGTPITVQLTVRAQGIAPNQLPVLEVPEVPGAAVYPDQESTRDLTTAQGLGGERSRRFAVVPQRAGELRIPPQRIRWWNTDTGRSEVAELPERRIRVVDAAGGGVQLSNPQADVQAAHRDGLPVGADWYPSGNQWWWPLSTLLLALGWAWSSYRQRRRFPLPPPADGPRSRPPDPPALDTLLRAGDLAELAGGLRAAVPGGTVAGLQDVAERLEDPLQADAVRMLDRCLYGQGVEPAACRKTMMAAFSRKPRWRAARVQRPDRDVLPPLYR